MSEVMQYMSAIIIENYKEINKKNNLETIPTATEVYNEVLYNIDAKCYDYIYGISKDMINKDIIIDILKNNMLMFRNGSDIVNPTQLGIILRK